jgi:hypothetical protein
MVLRRPGPLSELRPHLSGATAHLGRTEHAMFGAAKRDHERRAERRFGTT